jgi:DNA invertase Pin-like site-specific DNA recombinase
MLTMLGAIAAFERDLMLERQREGIARAAAEGKYKGRAPTARAKAADVLRLAHAGRTREAIAADLGIGVSQRPNSASDLSEPSVNPITSFGLGAA